jgi:chaperone modulatory protein CbpM
MMPVDLENFLRESGIELSQLEFWVERTWVRPARSAPGLALTEADAARCLLIRDLKADFGVNDEGIDLVLHLIDQLHGLRRALLELGGRP